MQQQRFKKIIEFTSASDTVLQVCTALHIRLTLHLRRNRSIVPCRHEFPYHLSSYPILE